jgi:uncharacterized protein (TIGR02677 family)
LGVESATGGAWNVTEHDGRFAHADQALSAVAADSRRAVAYLVAPESDEYIAIMRVLEGSTADLTPDQVTTELRTAGLPLDTRVVESRLSQLRDWSAASARSDQAHVRRVQDLLLKNFRYTATRAGRQVQRFYDTALAGTPAMREIPLQSLNVVVTALEELVGHPGDGFSTSGRVHSLFIAHDDLDSALVGAEDTLMALANRFDLDDDRTGELKTLLVSYATRVAVELEKGADRAIRALDQLRPRFGQLAAASVAASDAADLITHDLLSASKGGREEDWIGLTAWFDPLTGRSARFSQRMVTAIPTFYTNLRRLHTSGESGTSRARALLLAKACQDPEHGTMILLAALGDHSWRKLHGETEETGVGRTPSWRDGPRVELPPGLRTHAKAGIRGRAARPIDDTAAKAAVAMARQERLIAHREALLEIFGSEPGAMLSHPAARVALVALMDAVRQAPSGTARTAVRDGLACTIFWTGTGVGGLRAPSWRAWLPGRALSFHRPGKRPANPVRAADDPGGLVQLDMEGVVA